MPLRVFDFDLFIINGVITIRTISKKKTPPQLLTKKDQALKIHTSIN